jgi:hypothetical protein
MFLFRVASLAVVVGCAKPAPASVVNPPVEPPSMDMPDLQTAEPAPLPSPKGGTSCELEVALPCSDGFADGCIDGRTTHHVCIATTELAGPPCEQEVAKVCPDGQVDACVYEPKLALTHVCVTP